MTEAYNIPLFKTAQERDAWCAENAASFELVRGKFRGPVDRAKVSNMQEARAHAEADRAQIPWRVYAIMPCGASAHVCNLK